MTTIRAPERAAEPHVTYDKVTRTVYRTLGNPGIGYYALLITAVAMFAFGVICLLYLLR